jgi:excisionase family DNA binding protein
MTDGQTSEFGSLRLFTPKEASEILRVRQSWIERQAASRKIPFTMLGGCYRFTAEHLSRIVQIFEAGPDSPVTARSVVQIASNRQARRRAVPQETSTVRPLRARPRHPQWNAA